MLSRRRFGLLVLLAVVVVEVLVAVTSAWVAVASRGRVVGSDEVPDGAPHTVIVLGSKVDDGQPGDYVRARLDVAVDLYRERRADRILVSGNDADDAGNEVRVMRAYLESAGIPPTAIVDDGLGLNTAATCERAADRFGIRSALIVTQNFHVGRAVMLCDAYGLDATGVIAPCGHCSIFSVLRNHLRESLGSRPRAVVDSLRAR
ncbi:YdcF family protein [Gordonia sp. HY285]|uniref:SanA/YdcF family protein n=1 Tax=Gordonia liuliyuniae TaxID=2911517 RepID=UPI001F24EAFD|nr:YdcF family protein [Gordonia liuliyuniae]MCF8608706.1 YdcF family protein [Gordonia liuliyuniae]